MSDVESHEIEYLQNQIYDLLDSVRTLENKVYNLELENTLLRSDLNTIKNEGCWRFVEDPDHTHRKQK